MIRSPSLAGLDGVRHGFFTRRGGVSEGIYRSLNCGLGAGDSAEAVAENRARAMRRLDAAPEALATCRQAHSATAIRVDRAGARQGVPADGLVTNIPDLALGVLTADCAPVLLADPEARVIGAAHAGWRGALAGVIEATVEAMCALGARAPSIRASIGPCIGRESYEVGPEFPDPFLAEDAANRVLFRNAARAGHFLFDLAGYVGRRLSALGLEAVCRLDHDTYADAERFFSYRRGVHEGDRDYGRALSAILLSS